MQTDATRTCELLVGLRDVIGAFEDGRLFEVDRYTTEQKEGHWTDDRMDKTPRQSVRALCLEADWDLAKVRVAGSNPVVRSMG